MRSMGKEICSHKRPIGMSPNSNFAWMSHLKKWKTKKILSLNTLCGKYNSKMMELGSSNAYSTPDDFIYGSLGTCNQLLYIPKQGDHIRTCQSRAHLGLSVFFICQACHCLSFNLSSYICRTH